MSYAAAFESLADVYLEDSWVLEVLPRVNGVAFRMEVVLTPNHSFYEKPKPGEQHCYGTAWLDVVSDQPIELALSGLPAATDLTGSEDHGNIDRFAELDQSRWVIEGNWGRAIVIDPSVAVRLD